MTLSDPPLPPQSDNYHFFFKPSLTNFTEISIIISKPRSCHSRVLTSQHSLARVDLTRASSTDGGVGLRGLLEHGEGAEVL